MKNLKLALVLALCSVTAFYSCNNDDDEPLVEICDDGIDNDNDGFIDCEDNDCESEAICAVEICNDGIDNDEDGYTDCEDIDCDSDPSCAVEICDDGIDNDNDGFTDCEDVDCDLDPNC